MSDVTVTTLPVADAAFRVHVDLAMQRLGTPSVAALQAEIRKAYPRAAVRPGDPLGSLGAAARWYVYRDGGGAPARADDDWWVDGSLPTTVVGDDGRYLDANDAAAALFGVSKAAIVGAATGSFTRHESDPALAARLIEVLRRAGELRSTAIVLRSGGDEVPIEFHMSRLPGERRQYRTVMRPANPDWQPDGHRRDVPEQAFVDGRSTSRSGRA